ncbi:MAG TPA: sigma-70 family RNA polymerase sigma factor [Gemmatimonadaceae bacterium]|nr:sigma-70 family RNA polymerase sigma factor [Gemmatimonadaceae bacterium]
MSCTLEVEFAPERRVAGGVSALVESSAAQPSEGQRTFAEEAALLARVQHGDVAAFDLVVRRYLRRAFAIAYRVLGHREDAEDLVQDAFLTALERIASFDLSRPFGPWFFRIVVNRGLNARKARAIRRTEAMPAEALETAEPSPAGLYERTEIRERFQAALAGLSQRQRLIVELADIDGMSGVEIAAMLGVSQGTVRWHLHMARHALRKALAPLRGERTHE